MLSLEQIAKFEQAMQGPGPEGDPNWEITQGLLKLTVAQAKEIIVMQEQLGIADYGSEASTAVLADALSQSMGKAPVSSNLSDADVKAAVDGLSAAVQQYQSGQQIMAYAGKALKFASLFI
jgi:hypothetical protein